MPIIHALCDSFKEEILRGLHSEVASYRIALYTSQANLDEETTGYTMLGEVPEINGYIRGGKKLTGYRAFLDEGVAIIDFDDPVWGPNVTIKAKGALIYNETMLNKAVAVMSFGSSHSCINGEFRVQFPEPTRQTALIRIV